MYIPKHFEGHSQQEAVKFMQRYNFGTLVSVINNLPFATHLPFLIKYNNDNITITSHFAKANPHAGAIDESNVLVIFTEPHAYISPRLYEKEESVPTWNYIAIHAYGKAKVINDQDNMMELFEQSILTFDPNYLSQWKNLPEKYKINMMKGTVGFEIEVTDLQVKEKLSQNRTDSERHNIIQSLSTSHNSNESDLAAYMLSKQRKSDQ